MCLSNERSAVCGILGQLTLKRFDIDLLLADVVAWNQ